MSGMNRTVLVLGATTLVFGSASAYLYNDLRETRAESVALQARVADLEKASPATDARVVRNPSAVPVNPFGPTVEAPPETATAPAAAPPPKRVATMGGRPASGMVEQPFTVAGVAGPGFGPRFAGGWEQQRKMMEDPDYRDAMKRQQKMMLPRMYPELQQVLQIDSRQADELYDLLAEQQMRQMTEQRNSPFQNRNPNSPPDPAVIREWQEGMQRRQTANETEIASLLGDAGYQQWNNYKSTMPARAQIRELRSTLEGAGVPLQHDQSEKLVAAIASQQQTQMQSAMSFTSAVGVPGARIVGAAPIPLSGFGNNGPVDRTAFMEQQVERTRTQQQQMRSTVAPHLSSQQLEQFERMQAQQLEMQEINLKMMRAQQAAEARGDLPSSNQNVMTVPGVVGPNGAMTQSVILQR